MSEMFRVLACAACFSNLASATAQLVYVPDLEFRNYLEGVIPGVVDANGYIDSTDPVVSATQELTIDFDWSPADVSGVEAFTNLQELHLMNDSGWISLTISAFPSNLVELEFSTDFVLTSVPPFPATLDNLYMWAIMDLQTLPPLPTGLSDLVLGGMLDLVAVPALPTTMYRLIIADSQSLTSLPTLPTEIYDLTIESLSVVTLPACPQVVENEMGLSHLLNLTSLPQLPNTVGYMLSFWNLPLIDSIAQLPDSCPWLDFDEMSALTFVGELPSDLSHLFVEGGGPSCFPPLPSDLTLIDLSYSDVVCLPNVPQGVPYVNWDGIALLPNEVPICNLLTPACAPAACGIGGMVYLDANADGDFDLGEAPYGLSTIATTPGNWFTSVDPDGTYNLGVPPSAYSIVCSVSTPYVQSINPVAHSASFLLWDEVDTLNDFGIVLQPNIQDIVVNITEYGAEVPGFVTHYGIQYLNYGTQIQDGSISFTYDAAMTFVNSTPAPDAISGNTLTWNFTQLQVGQQRAIDITLNTPVGTTLGTLVSHTATTEPLATDQTPLDNIYTHTNIVVGSLDPNDKTVEPTQLTPAEVAAGERVNYTVRFQNTGTYQATRVIITDTLSSDLQWSTMQLVAASHAQTWYIHDGVLHVIFDNINLPDSNANEPASHGFAKFSMVPVSTLMLGASVSNTANIYFDFNEPVITNAAVFTVDDAQSVNGSSTQTLTLSPNPVSDVLNIALDRSATNLPLSVVDLTGRVVLTGFVSGTRAQLHVQALRAGSYQLRLGEQMVGRFVKR